LSHWHPSAHHRRRLIGSVSPAPVEIGARAIVSAWWSPDRLPHSPPSAWLLHGLRPADGFWSLLAAESLPRSLRSGQLWFYCLIATLPGRAVSSSGRTPAWLLAMVSGGVPRVR
jgi:hypothetical protein